MPGAWHSSKTARPPTGWKRDSPLPIGGTKFRSHGTGKANQLRLGCPNRGEDSPLRLQPVPLRAAPNQTPCRECDSLVAESGEPECLPLTSGAHVGYLHRLARVAFVPINGVLSCSCNGELATKFPTKSKRGVPWLNPTSSARLPTVTISIPLTQSIAPDVGVPCTRLKCRLP